MKYDFVETMTTIFYGFNSPTGTKVIIAAFLIGILMCIFGKEKGRIVCSCILLVLLIAGMVFSQIDDTTELLISPLFMMPLFVITFTIFFVYDFIKTLIGIKHKSNNQ